MMNNSGSCSPSGQWYPQNPSWQSTTTMPQQFSAPGTPHPQGGYNSMMQQQQQQQKNNMNNSEMLNSSGTWNGNQMPTPPGYGAGGSPGMMPGQMGMYPGMGGMNGPPGMMQPSACDCCGYQQGGGCCGNQPGGGCCGSQPGGGCCCGNQQGGGCCPMPGEPPDPFVCNSTPMNPACYECVYNCFDYSFLLMCILFVLTVAGFGVVMGTKNIDDLYTKFDAMNASELDAAMKPHILWMNVIPCNNTNTTNETSSSSGSSGESSDNVSNAASQSTENISPSAGTGRSGTPGRLEPPLAVSSTPASSTSTSIPGNDSSSSGNHTPDCVVNYTKPCTERRLKGSFGPICMEDNLNANTFAIQLSHWNNARDTLWLLAMAFTGFAILFAALIHVQRSQGPMGMMGGGGGAAMMNPSMLPPDKQAELMKMTPQQQQQFIMEYQMQQAGHSQQQMQQYMMTQQGQQQGCGGGGALEIYETPFYAFVRFAWGFVGLVAFAWAINLCLSFWAFSTFYVDSTDGPLREFWHAYAGKFSGSVVVVTVYLAWPLCNVLLELVVWVVGFLPWLIIRSTCKPNIGNYRPDLPASQLPGWIRTDMFFMDFADLKRLGFSRNAWVILTGSSRPFFDTCCLDPTIDTDPNMTSLLVQRYQFQMQSYAMMPPRMRGMMPPPMPPPQLNMTPEQFQQQFGMAGGPGSGQSDAGMYGMAGQGNATPGGGYPTTPVDGGLRKPEEDGGEPGTGRHRRRRRGGSADNGAAAMADKNGHNNNNNNGAATPQGSSGRRRRHRSHADPAGDAGAGSEAGTPGRRKHRSRSRSKSRGAGAAAAAAAGAAGATDGARKSRRRSPSRSVSHEVAVPVAEDGHGNNAGGADDRGSKSHRHRRKTAGGEEGSPSAGGAAEGASRHRRSSPSRSKSKSKKGREDKKAKKDRDPGADLDALMQL